MISFILLLRCFLYIFFIFCAFLYLWNLFVKKITVWNWPNDHIYITTSLCKFSEKWDYPCQFSIFSEKTTWFKPSSLCLNYQNELNYAGLHFIVSDSMVQTKYSISKSFLKMAWHYRVLNFLVRDNMVKMKQSISKFHQKCH